MSTAPSPQKIEQLDAGTLGITWSDGLRLRYPVRALRLGCTCAACVNEWTGERLMDEAQIPEDVHPEHLETVGLYGLRIRWSDGHDTGIYTHDHLRKIGETATDGSAHV